MESTYSLPNEQIIIRRLAALSSPFSSSFNETPDRLFGFSEEKRERQRKTEVTDESEDGKHVAGTALFVDFLVHTLVVSR